MFTGVRKQLVKKETNKVANKGKLILRRIRIRNFNRIVQQSSEKIAIFWLDIREGSLRIR